MKVVLQVVNEATVSSPSDLEQSIRQGFVMFVGFTHTDTLAIIDRMIQKILNLRVFADANGKTNLSLADIQGEILCVPNFTLYADVSGSRRPSFTLAAKPVQAKEWFTYLRQHLSLAYPRVKFGVFGEDMSVVVHNNGPFTLVLNSDE